MLVTVDAAAILVAMAVMVAGRFQDKLRVKKLCAIIPRVPKVFRVAFMVQCIMLRVCRC